jgi:hypothetical protein
VLWRAVACCGQVDQERQLTDRARAANESALTLQTRLDTEIASYRLNNSSDEPLTDRSRQGDPTADEDESLEGAKESCTEAADDSQSFAATLRQLQAEEELKEQAEGSHMAPSRSPPELAPPRAVQTGRAVDHDWVQLRDANGDPYYHDYVGGATTWRASPLVMAAVGIDQTAQCVCAWLSGCGVN